MFPTSCSQIVQKSDGGFLYSTTDLAALAHRVNAEKAQRILYVTDAGQAQHFQMVFQAAQKTSIVNPADTELVHVPFGLVLGEDGKKIKSRSGDSVKLRELLDEAVRRAEQNEITRLSTQRGSSVDAAADASTSASTIASTVAVPDGPLTDLGLTGEELQNLQHRARVLGLGAVKYADLSMHRESSYRFSFAKMLSLSGNTAPYMIYAYVRIRGIQRKAAAAALSTDRTETVGTSSNSISFTLSTPEEVSLGKHLIRFADVVTHVGNDLCPSRVSTLLCTCFLSFFMYC